ncbi:MAG: hypothetical protein U1E15_06105 [Hyphomicrobiales bacterium]
MVVVPNQAEGQTHPQNRIFHAPDDGHYLMQDVLEATRLLCDLAVPITAGSDGRVDLRAEGLVSMLSIIGREMERAYHLLTTVKN